MKDVPEIMMIFDVKNAKPASIPWLPQTTESIRTPRVPSDKGIFASLQKVQPQKGLWDLLQWSMPPFLARKYHIVNIDELRKDHGHICDYDRRVNYISIASSFMMWNEAFGITLLDCINDKQDMYFKYINAEVRNTRCISQWKEFINDNITYLKMTFLGQTIKAPTGNDLCTKASEFLLEPCIHIQLPWKPVLLHQWLTAAFAEVLIIERDSVEFRSLPFSKKMLPLAESLLSLIRQLKERILLGFVLLSEQVSVHPQFNPRAPDLLLDEVVLPSVPILQFVISGKAHKMLKLMKVSEYSRSQKIKNLLEVKVVERKNYEIDSFLAEFNDSFCYNYEMWKMDGVFEEAYPFPCLNEFDEFIVRFQAKTRKFGDGCGDSMPVMIEMLTNEASLLDLTDEQKIVLALKTIKEQIIEKGTFPNLPIALIERILREPKVVPKDEVEIFHDEIIKSTLQYNEVYKMLLGCEKENSVVAQLITLVLKYHEKNLLTSIIGYMSIFLQATPVVTKLESRTPINIKSMIQELKQIEDNIKNQTRSKLWSQLPPEWCKPVNLNETTPVGFDPKAHILAFQNRIGRLVYNIAVDSFEVALKGGESSPDWTTIQYVLPCIASSFLEECRITPFNHHLLAFIHEVIKSYEKRYVVWKTECLPRDLEVKIYHPYPFVPDELTRFYQETVLTIEWSNLNWKVRENLRLLLGIKTTNMMYTTTITGIDQILNYIHVWPSSVTHLIPDAIIADKMLLMLNTWWKFAFEFTEKLFHICVALHKVPIPGSEIIACPKLGQLYHTSAIISEIECVYDLTERFKTQNSELKCEIEDGREEMKQSRYEILRTVLNVGKMSKKQLENFIEAKSNLELVHYAKLKRFRKIHKTAFKICLLDLLPLSKVYPNLKPAVMHYINGDLAAVEEMLPLFAAPAQKRKMKKLPRMCRNCGKKEGVKKFVACEKCVKEKYPDVNYFCGRQCQDARWKSEHMAEHLEFELGLGDFANLSLGK